MGLRHRARELAVRLLYQMDMTDQTPDAALAQLRSPGRRSPELLRFTEHLVRGTWSRREELDALLEESSDNWKVERMPVVDRNVLRLAAFELLEPEDAPPAVVIDEAIEIAKRYGNSDSGPFVNGVLDAVRMRLSARATAPPPPE